MSKPAWNEDEWFVTNALVDDVTRDLKDAVGYGHTGLSRRIDLALADLDAKHLDRLAYILGIVVLQVRRMANERARQEDEEQVGQYGIGGQPWDRATGAMD